MNAQERFELTWVSLEPVDDNKVAMYATIDGKDVLVGVWAPGGMTAGELRKVRFTRLPGLPLCASKLKLPSAALVRDLWSQRQERERELAEGRVRAAQIVDDFALWDSREEGRNAFLRRLSTLMDQLFDECGLMPSQMASFFAERKGVTAYTVRGWMKSAWELTELEEGDDA